MRHPFERQPEGDDPAAVDAGRDLAGLELSRLRVHVEAHLLDRVFGEAVALRGPSARAAESEHPGVVPGAVVVDQPRRATLLRPELEVVLRRVGPREQRTHGGDLLRRVAVRGTGDCELVVRQVVSRADERKRLERFRRGTHEAGLRKVPGCRDDLAAANRDGMNPMHGLDHSVPAHFDDDRFRHGRSLRPVAATVTQLQQTYTIARGRMQRCFPAYTALAFGAMPELPEMEAWRRQLDGPVAAFPVAKAGPAHIATLQTFDPPVAALEGRQFRGAERRGKRLLFPTADEELVLLVHLMTAGRLRFVPAGGKAPKSPAFRLEFAGGAQLLLTEAGKKKRAGVWLLTPEAAEAELAHLGPEALGLGPERLGEIVHGESRRLHALLRDQRLIAGIGRAWANEILHAAKLSPYALSGDLDDGEVERLAAAIDEELERGLELRERGASDAETYRVHRRLGEPCHACGTPLARVDFEEHTIFYCPTCQTGGRVLKDRRLSRLLR